MAFRAFKQRARESSAEVQPQSLIQVASRASHALAKLDADLRAGGFGPDGRGLAHELYDAFTAAAVAAKGAEEGPVVWAIGRALAVDLDMIGARRAAQVLLDGLLAFGARHARPQILERLKEAEAAIDPVAAARRREAANAEEISNQPSAAAASAGQSRPASQPESEPEREPDPGSEIASVPSPPVLPAVEAGIAEGPTGPLQVEPSASASPALPAILPDGSAERMKSLSEAFSSPAGSPPSPILPPESPDRMPDGGVTNSEPLAPVSRTDTPAAVLAALLAAARSDDSEACKNELLAEQEASIPVAAPELFSETGLKIGPDERPVPALADHRSARRPSRRGGEYLKAAVAAVTGIAVYLLAAREPGLLQHSLSMAERDVIPLTGAAAVVDPIAKAPRDAMSATASASLAVADIGAETAERLPPVGQGLLFTSGEVRYCVFQGRRLGYLRGELSSNYAIQHFNRLVVDFNTRCKSFRFQDNSLQAADRLADAREDRLKADAAGTLAAWVLGQASPLVDLQTFDGAFEVQAKLRSLGYYRHTVDGVWGPRSDAALSSFRQSMGLGPDSAWDRATQTALLGK